MSCVCFDIGVSYLEVNMENLDKGVNNFTSAIILSQMGQIDKDQTVEEFGFDRVVEETEKAFLIWDEALKERFNEYCDFTENYGAQYGEDADGYSVGIPLDQLDVALNIGKDTNLNNARLMITMALQGDLNSCLRLLVRSLLNNKHNFTHQDHVTIGEYSAPNIMKLWPLLTPETDLIPSIYYPSKNRKEAHNHYSASGSLTKAVLYGLVENVSEHEDEKDIVVIINPRMAGSIERLGKIDDSIRFKQEAWWPFGFLWITNLGTAKKPLMCREHKDNSKKGLRLNIEDDLIFTARRLIGFAPVQRHQSAIHQIVDVKYNPLDFLG
jgi:hypothetical protein